MGQGVPDHARDKRAYDLYLNDAGLIWADIARALGMRSKQSACLAARRHAERNGLDWPLAFRYQPGIERRAYELKRGGLSWSEVAERLTMTCGSDACKYARRHAEWNGLDWPLCGGTPSQRMTA